MLTVNIAELKDSLSDYLNKVVHGEEILIRNRKKPIAKIVPLDFAQDTDAEEIALAAEGKLNLPNKRLTKEFWSRFWSMPKPRVASGSAVDAVIADRNED